jgi:hypothetical protein
MTFNPQAQPPQPAHSHSYNSTYRSPPAAYASASSRPSPYAHPSYYQQHYQPQGAPGSVDMPRSISYPNYTQGYPASYMPGQPYPSHHPSLPPLSRHTSTSTIGEDPNRSGMGYSFGHRLPLTDRPFKCDECVQSFVSFPLVSMQCTNGRTVITISSDTRGSISPSSHSAVTSVVKRMSSPLFASRSSLTTSFSRKDALRRHWLVKGCRGEDGATAPISESFSMSNPSTR